MPPRRITLAAALALLLWALGAAQALGAIGFVRQWPIQGGGGGEQGGVAVNLAGTEVYVADPAGGSAGRILVYSPEGALLRVLDKEHGVDVERPLGLAVDSLGRLIAFEGDRNRLAVLTTDGTVLRTIAPTGADAFDDLAGSIATDGVSTYVADTRASRIQVLNPDGSLQFSIPLGGSFVTDVAVDRTAGRRTIYAVLIFGTAGCEARVQRYDAGGTLLGQWPVTDGALVACAGRPGIAVDARTGEVLVSSQGGTRPGVRRYTPEGVPVGAPLLGSGAPGAAFKAAGLAVDDRGTVYVRDTQNAVLRFGQVAPAPDLQGTIPDPRTASAGPTGATYPGTIALRSLKTSKCVRVVVRSRAPARVLATIFSGIRSIRLFGQKEVLFRTAPARKVVCIRVPGRAHTFDVRTSLHFALGYRLGTQPRRRGERIPAPVLKRIRLVP